MTGATRELAMFPLGSVLFPAMPLPLRIFEPRYVELLSAVLAQADPEFGVVLIERGSEVGGGDARFGVGTTARVVSIEQAPEWVEVLATGGARFEVVRWLKEDPFPLAEVRELAPIEFDPTTPSGLAAAEELVRATITRASEFVELRWPANIELSRDPAQRIWQVTGIAPLNPLDQYALLRSETAAALLARLVEDTRAADALFAAGWSGEG